MKQFFKVFKLSKCKIISFNIQLLTKGESSIIFCNTSELKPILIEFSVASLIILKITNKSDLFSFKNYKDNQYLHTDIV